LLVGATTERVGYDEGVTAVAAGELRAAAVALLPSLADAPVLRQWAGLRPYNPVKPHAPVMGPHPALSNVVVCAGHFKTGIGMAPVVSERVARAVLDL
jgi:glycine oxidase